MWDDILSGIDNQTTPQKAVAAWGGALDSIRLINTGINLVYSFSIHNQTCFLRLTHEKLRPMQALQAALQYQQHLQNAHVPVCPLILSSNKTFIESVLQDSHVFLAHVCAKVPGAAITFDNAEALYFSWGKALGQLHAAARDYHPGSHRYGRWEDDGEELTEYAQNEPPAIQAVLQDVLAHFIHYPQTRQNYGLIHGDHRKGNVLTDGRLVSFIDFDLPRYCWFMDDVSRPFFSSIVWKEQNWQDKLQPYIEGYRAAHPLQPSELVNFSWFIRYKLLDMYLWTKYNWHGETAPGGMKTKKWLASLEEMILNRTWVDSLDNLIAKIT